MSSVRVTGGSLSNQLLQTDVVVLFSFSDTKQLVERNEAKVLGKDLTRTIRTFAKTRGFTSNVKETMYLPGRGKGMIVVVGLGKTKDADAETVRRACADALLLFEKLQVKTIGVSLPSLLNAQDKDVLTAAAEGFVLGHYNFDKYLTGKKKRPTPSVQLFSDNSPTEIKELLRRSRVITDGTIFARDLENDNSDEIHPEAFVKTAKEALAGLPMKVTVFDEKRIQKEGLNLIYAVGRASKFPPRFMIAEYAGNPDSTKVTALVGKGITFDTGGVNLKPSDRSWIEEMHMDMAGAATVLSALKVAAELKLRVNLISVMPLAENAIGGNSYKPGSVLRSYSGKTVEIKNTDAEGRLVLADALAYTIKNHAPSEVIDIATLTGSCIVALGETIAGLMSNNDTLARKIFEAGERTQERVWQLPIYPEHTEAIKGLKGDLQNVGKMTGGSGAATITAAAFLKEFIGRTPWAHLDIAGTGMSFAKREYTPKGGTGFGVRLLVDYLSEDSV